MNERSGGPKVVEAYHDYAAYQSRTDREIPIVFLEPRNRPSAPWPHVSKVTSPEGIPFRVVADVA